MTTEAEIYEAIRTPRGKGKSSVAGGMGVATIIEKV